MTTDKPDNGVFCTAPWVHLHSWTNGKVFPCCFAVSNDETQLGNLQTSTVDEVLNSHEFRALRLRMMTGERSAACQRCYEMEDAGFYSMREDFNHTYSNHDALIEKTYENGHMDIFNWKLRYWDIRISNLCNMKCRTCGPEFSNKWVDDIDHKKEPQRAKKFNGIKPIKVREDFQSVLDEIPNFVENVEKLYFAGGEPIITQEHWDIITELRKHNRYDAKLIYQTNMSRLKFKQYDFLEVLRDFQNVRVMASIDALGAHGSIMRHGISNDVVMENFRTLKEQYPNLDVWVSLTVSNLNVMNLGDVYNGLIKTGLVKPEHVSINPVFDPLYYSPTSLPTKLKQIAIERVEQIVDKDHPKRGDFNSLVKFIKGKDNSENWPKFWYETRRLDRLRKENMAEEFLSELSPFNDAEIVTNLNAETFITDMQSLVEKTDKSLVALQFGEVQDLERKIAAYAHQGLENTIVSEFSKYDIKNASLVWYYILTKAATKEDIIKYTGHWPAGNLVIVSADVFKRTLSSYQAYLNTYMDSVVFQNENLDDNPEREIHHYDVRTILAMMLFGEKMIHKELIQL